MLRIQFIEHNQGPVSQCDTNPDEARRAASAPTVQAPCSEMAARPDTLPQQRVLIHSAAPADEHAAREKARYVAAVWAAHQASSIALKDAAPLVAAAEPWPALVEGKRNLLAGSKSYLNYRQWANKLGRTQGRRGAPDADNWRALLPAYRGSRKYEAPGDARFWPLLANLYEHPNQLTLRYAHRLAVMAAGKAGIADVPSYDQARHYYEHHVDRKTVLIARNGEDWFRNHVAGYIEREAPARDEAWVGDHHVLDMGVRVWDPDKCAWRAERPWLTAWLDWGTLTFVGWQIRTLSPNRDAIERSLRGAIRRNDGCPPVVLYVDNGADYKAKGFTRPAGSGDEQRVGSIASALGCKSVFAIPYNARAKIIERMFREVCEKFSKLFAGYRGSNPSKRPGEADWHWAHPEQLPTLDECAAAFENWLHTIFHETTGDGKILKGKSPREARLAAAPARPALEPATIYKAFLRDVGARAIRRGGYVLACNREYKSELLWSLQENEKVRVKVDPDDVDRAWIYTVDNREIGPAQVRRLLPGMMGDDADPETIEEHRRQMAEQRRQVKAIKAASADRRELGRFLSRPEAPAATAGMIAGDEAPRRLSANTAAAPATPAAAPVSAATAAMVAELDAVMVEQSRQRLDRKPAVDVDDLEAELAELEAEAAEQEPAAVYDSYVPF